jgi:integrase
VVIKQRGNSWQVDFINPEGKRVRKNFKDAKKAKLLNALAEAHNWKAVDELLDIKAKTHIDSSNTTQPLKYVLELVNSEKWSNQRDSKASYRKAYCAVEFFGGDTPVSKITNDSIEEYVIYLKSIGNSASTINAKLSTLSLILRKAYKKNWASKLPLIERQELNNERERYLDDAEIKKIRNHFKSIGDQLMLDWFNLSLLTGLRTNMVLKLQRANYKGDMLHYKRCESKNKKPYTVPLVEEAKEIVERRLKDSDKSFLLSYSGLIKRWGKMKQALGYEEDTEFIPYITRHTTASHLLNEAISLDVVGAILNHSSRRVTERYAHLSQETLNTHAQALSLIGVA